MVDQSGVLVTYRRRNALGSLTVSGDFVSSRIPNLSELARLAVCDTFDQPSRDPLPGKIAARHDHRAHLVGVMPRRQRCR